MTSSTGMCATSRTKLKNLALGLLLASLLAAGGTRAQAENYRIVATGQDQCFDEVGQQIACSLEKDAVDPRQDGPSVANPASYKVNGDGTVSDLVTGLIWARDPSEFLSFNEAKDFAETSNLAGYNDWRVPTIRELYSLIDYRGSYSGDTSTSRPYIDTSVFGFTYAKGTGLGDASSRRRPIDVQEWSSTEYVGVTMGKDKTIFGVNFADGRIKGYPLMDPANQMRTPHRLKVRLVRGPLYGVNVFDKGKTTITDHATGLMWHRETSSAPMTWSSALGYCAGSDLEGFADWRLPSAKELHSVIDYSRIPAIDPVFSLADPSAYLWSSTTHLEEPPHGLQSFTAPFQNKGELAVYAAVGRALGNMEVPPGSGNYVWTDVHGAGAMRSDPKTARIGDFQDGFGPQGDDIRGENYVLCVRNDKQ